MATKYIYYCDNCGKESNTNNRYNEFIYQIQMEAITTERGICMSHESIGTQVYPQLCDDKCLLEYVQKWAEWVIAMATLSQKTVKDRRSRS